MEFFKKHKSGIIGTIIFHLIIAVIFLIFGYTTPLPLPGEEGILINFGTTDMGSGPEEPMYSEKIQEQAQEESVASEPETTPTESEEGLTTQDFEDAPAIEEQGKKEEKKEEKPTPKPEPKEEEKVEKKEERKVNTNALFPGRDRNSESSSSEGENSGEGNQGSTTGSVDSQNHSGGNSMGTSGTSYSLAGRNPLSLPKPTYNSQAQGIVKVEITVDKNGNVIRARAILKGSTTQDATLWAAAEKAARKAKFNTKPGSTVQQGTITYTFKLQ